MLAVAGLEALLLALWLVFQRDARYATWPFWATLLLAAVCMAALAWRCWQSLPVGWLLWSGSVWRLQEAAPDMQAGLSFLKCTLVFDAQRCMLLRLSQTEPTAMRQTVRWVWVGRASAPEHWHALRCAVIWAQTAAVAAARTQ